MAQKHRSKRQRQRQRARKQAIPKVSLLLKAGRYFSSHHLAILGIFIPCLAGFITYYSVFAEPDIRHLIHDEQGGTYVSNFVDNDGNLVMMMTFTDSFKNYSLKSGFIDKVEFVPMNALANVEVKINDIEKKQLWWRQEQSVKITYTVTVKPELVRAVDASDNLPILAIRAFDNTGKIVGEEQYPRPYGMALRLALQIGEPRRIPDLPIGTRLIP